MHEGWFAEPVAITVGIVGDIHHISSARQAAALLTQHWPDAGTPKYRAARQACLAAVHGEKPPDVARAAFIEAAREARILVD
ncbi:hypothetical protein ATER59S_01670 [Aquamicrobium terrae]